MSQVSCEMKGKVQLAGDEVWAMVHFDMSLFLRTEEDHMLIFDRYFDG